MTTTVARRPADRRHHIADAAVASFCSSGYHRTAMNDIAAAVGITARAIYRHFGSKHDLLAATVTEGLAAIEEACDAATLGDAIDALTVLFERRRELGVLLLRESRHLQPQLHAQLRARADASVERIADLLCDERAISESTAVFLSRSMFSVLASPAFHTATVSTPMSVVLRPMVDAVLGASSTPDSDDPIRPTHEVDAASRRESLLSAAVHLFAQRGYGAVRMEDVGAAVGITGPSIYEHFSGKSDLLMSALTRGAEWLRYGLDSALGSASDDEDALRRLVESYGALAFSHRDLMAVLLHEALALPPAEFHVLRRLQHDYVAEWVRLVRSLRPGLDEPRARFLVGAGLQILNDAIAPIGGISGRRVVTLTQTLLLTTEVIS